jgi:hypothetical protein
MHHISLIHVPVASMWVVALHSLFLYSDPPPPLFWFAQAIFEPNLFLCKYPSILNPSYSSYLLAYKDGKDRVF